MDLVKVLDKRTWLGPMPAQSHPHPAPGLLLLLPPPRRERQERRTQEASPPKSGSGQLLP